MIDDNTTFAELKKMDVAEVIAALLPDATPVPIRRAGVFGNLFFRPMDFPEVGSVVRGHKHNYGHTTNVISGEVYVRFTFPEGATASARYAAPAKIFIDKDVIHEFTALQPGTYAECIYPLRDCETGKIVDNWDGGLEAYQ